MSFREITGDNHIWTNARVRSIAYELRRELERHRAADNTSSGITPEEVEQALRWAAYPADIRKARMLVYSNKDNDNIKLLKDTSPFPVTVVSLGEEWKGTLDKLLGYWSFIVQADDNDIIIMCDAFDVFGNGFDGHELLRRYFSFNRPIVIATEENIYPREAAEDAHYAVAALVQMNLLDASAGPSRYVNAGGIIGIGWALKRMYNDMRFKMIALHPGLLQEYSDIHGHWFLHAYDQYELWAFFLRHVADVFEHGAECLVALDTEQLIFGSTVMVQENWPELLRDVKLAEHSIDVDLPLVFDAPQSLFEIRGCHARFVGRKHFPIFWHGHGPLKGAWLGLRGRLRDLGCFPTWRR